MTNQALKKLRSKLPRGYGKKLSEITGKHESSIYQALTGKFESPEIINAAIALATDHAQNSNKLIDKINSL